MSEFIVFEGIDGSGKSSVLDLLQERLEKVHFTKEPTDSKTGMMAQRIATEETSPYMDLFLYLADRVEHTERIRERLDQDFHVVCDRYWGSTAAYQSAYDEIQLEYAESIQKPFIRKPNLTFLLDLNPKKALKRISERSIKSKYEKLDFLQQVRDNYLELAVNHDWKIIDAEKGLEEVKSDISRIIEKEL